MNPEWKARYETAIDVARRAAQRALRYFHESVEVEWKHDQSPVTIADRETEQELRTALQERFPGDGFLGEEYGDTPGTTGFRWVLDPIDGTRSFVRHIPIWATLVGLEYRGEQIAGVAEVPTLGQTYHALRGQGAFCNDRRIRVSDVSRLNEAVMFYSSISWFVKAGKEKVFLDLSTRTQRQRGFGDFYGFVLVAQGSGEVMAEHGVHIWDVVALKPIVEEAGGRFTDWDGTPSVDRPDVIASNGKLHDEVLRILNSR
jgi:histidinol-phosphatase